MEKNYEIVTLPKEQWKGKTIPLTTRSDSYYDFEIDPLNADGCTIKIFKRQKRKSSIPRRNMIFLILYIRIIGKMQRPMGWSDNRASYWHASKFVPKNGQTG